MHDIQKETIANSLGGIALALAGPSYRVPAAEVEDEEWDGWAEMHERRNVGDSANSAVRINVSGAINVL